ncbi:hypothetical protein DUNSADRAFT_16388, partial [Dunaliella salina]
PVPATSLPLLHPQAATAAAAPPAPGAASGPPVRMALPGMPGVPPTAAAAQLPPQIVVMQPDGTFHTVPAPGPEGQQKLRWLCRRCFMCTYDRPWVTKPSTHEKE